MGWATLGDSCAVDVTGEGVRVGATSCASGSCGPSGVPIGVANGTKPGRSAGDPTSTSKRGAPPMKHSVSWVQMAPGNSTMYAPSEAVIVCVPPRSSTNVAWGAIAFTVKRVKTRLVVHSTVVVVSPRSKVTAYTSPRRCQPTASRR